MAVTHNSLSREGRGGLLDISPDNSDSSNALLAPVDYIRRVHWRSLVIRLGWFLVPSFLQGRHLSDQARPAKLGPTAYLDGMRGIASLCVFFCHFGYQSYSLMHGWGGEGANFNIMRLPFLRLIYAGSPAVSIFFIISGYALSYRPMKHIRNRNFKEFASGLSSMAFRRGIRLYLPIVASTAMCVVLVRMGVYEWTRPITLDHTYLRNIIENHANIFPSAYEQWRKWAVMILDGFDLFSWQGFDGYRYYDLHLWTIPTEFRCSFYLFAVMITTARLQTKFRFLTVAVVMYFTYTRSRWDFLLFLFGMVLVEWDHIRGAHTSHSSSPTLPLGEKEAEESASTPMAIFWQGLAVFGMYLMSHPDIADTTTPGFAYLSSFIPEWWDAERFRYMHGLGAAFFITAVGYLPRWQQFFNSPVCQYLGKISYALYLMHGPITKAIGYHWQKMAWDITGVEGDAYNVGFVLGACFCIPTIVWCADIFWRAVDIPTVQFAKWYENQLIVKAD